jgi:cysteinyl-tRNA synthetase
MHNGFVRVDNAKMSKSLGNFFTIRDVLKVYDPEVVRFFLVRAHYRTPINYSNSNLDDAKAGLTRLYTALKGFSGPAKVDWDEPHAQRFKAAMDDDFNTSEAVAELYLLANEVFQKNEKAISQLKALGAVLGLLQRDPQAFLQGGAGPEDKQIQEKIDARLAARKAKDYAKADRIRKELEASGRDPRGRAERHGLEASVGQPSKNSFTLSNQPLGARVVARGVLLADGFEFLQQFALARGQADRRFDHHVAEQVAR